MTNERQPNVIDRAHAEQSARNYDAVTAFLKAKDQEINAAQPAVVAQPEPVVAQVVEPAPANEFGTAWPTAEPVVPAWTETQPAPAAVEPAPAPAAAPSRRSRLANWFERAQDATTNSRAAHLGKAAVGLAVIALGVGASINMDLKAGDRNNDTAGAAEPAPEPFVNLSTVALTTTPPNTVNSALVEADIDGPAERRKFLLTATKTENGYKLANYENRMNALDKGDFQAENITADQAIAGVGLGAFSDTKAGESYGDAIINFNSRQDRKINASTGMSEREEQAFLRKLFTKKGGKTYIKSYTGVVENGYTDRSTKEANAERQHFQDIPVLVREVPGVGTNMWKIGMKDGIICLNPIRPVDEVPTTAITAAPGTVTRAITTTFVSQPAEGITQTVVDNQRDGIQVGPGKKPAKQKPGDQPAGETPGGETPPTVVPPKPKQDNNTTPGGVPGQNGGTPGQGQGEGPAGQGSDPTGHVPGEQHEPTPTPSPTPAPLPAAEPAPAVEPGEQTGQQPAPGAEPAPSTGTGQTVPVGDPDPQG